MATPVDKLKKHPRVARVDDERAIGNGIIVTLKQGWSFDSFVDNRVAGEDTPTAMIATVQRAQAFAGPYDQ